MLWEVIVILVIVWLIRRQWTLRRQFAVGKQLKTSLKCYPVIGHALMFAGSDEDRMRTFELFGREAIKSGGVTPIWEPNQLFICIADPAAAEVIMNQCLEKHEIAHVVKFLIGSGSLYASVPIWRSRRKLIIPSFATKYLNKYGEIFSRQSAIMADLIEREVGNGVFSFWDYISDYNLDSSCETTMGVTVNAQGVPHHALKMAIDEMCQIAAWRICQPWFRSDFVFKFMPCYHVGLRHRNTVWDFITKILEEKRDSAQKKKIGCTSSEETKYDAYSFLDVQLEAPDDQRLTERELLEEIIVLVLASLDTSATGTSFTVLMLCRHPDVQDKVFEELQEVFGESNRPVTSKDLSQLKYLEAVIKESLRLYTPVPLLVRRVDNDVTLPSGVTLVKDCGILLNLWAIHRNPEYWGLDADQFRPERFLDYTPKHPSAFMPFSYGQRNCIGYQYALMSMKTVLSTLLRRYKVISPPGVINEDPVRTKFDLMLRHVDNFQIQLEYRKKYNTSMR